MIDSLALNGGRLSPAQIDAYWHDGFLFPLPAMSAARAESYRRTLETIEIDWLQADLPQPLNTYKRVNAQAVIPMAYEIGADPAVLDIVEGILGPDILIYAVEFFIKEPQTRHIVSMHQDLTYWGMGGTQGLVTAWIALSLATPASGCMDFVKGSHKNPILPHEDTFDDNNLLSRGQEIRVDVRPEDKTAIEIHPGQMSLHHGLTIHGSGPNTSGDRRIAAVIRYVRPDVAQESGTLDYAMPVRGKDTLGHFIHYPPPASDFAPDALARYDAIRAAQAKVMMAGAKQQSAVY
ncbi:MAG: phytanoyl-CoA dioxygenase family protein [Pseudomonadota bacterium]